MDNTYNGWTNHATWNVALWLQNDEGLYDTARAWAQHGYKSMAHQLVEIYGATTPDGVAWQDSHLDIEELNEMMQDL